MDASRSSTEAATGSGLPEDIAFLQKYGVTTETLRRAGARAVREGVPASDGLVASGGVSTVLFYDALARHLGLRFVQSGIVASASVSAPAAIHAGAARLASGMPATWLLAPRGRLLELLLDARRLGRPMPNAIVTTPLRFSALVRRADEASMVSACESAPRNDPSLSARGATDRGFLSGLAAAGLAAIGAAVAAPEPFIVLIGLVFFAALSFRLLVCARGLTATPVPARLCDDRDLPRYTVLVPLYQEAEMVPRLVANLDRLDYPRSKLEIVLLVEADDPETHLACLAAPLGPQYEIIVVPRGGLRTKPRALNYALPLVRGTLLTIFDAEDAPEPQQLRQAASRFRHAQPEVACLQASLTIHNGRDHLIAHLFSLEYAALFDLFNRGIAAWRLPLALGGTSNHFRVEALRAAGGWDAWNVAEDADLGLRLARFGFRSEMLAAVTSEEAPANPSNWFRQRRRWTKGWMQCAAVLGRDFGRVRREFGMLQALAVLIQLASLVGGPLASLPLSLLAMVQIERYGLPALTTTTGLCEATLWMSVLVLGPVSILWPTFVAARARRMRLSPLVVIALLPYQLMIGLAAWGGLIDLIVNPYHWRKTRHGLAQHRQDLSAGFPLWLGRAASGSAAKPW